MRPEELTFVMQQLGITSNGLAEMSGVSLTTVWRWQHGKRKVSTTQKAILDCHVLRVYGADDSLEFAIQQAHQRFQRLVSALTLEEAARIAEGGRAITYIPETAEFELTWYDEKNFWLIEVGDVIGSTGTGMDLAPVVDSFLGSDYSDRFENVGDSKELVAGKLEGPQIAFAVIGSYQLYLMAQRTAAEIKDSILDAIIHYSQESAMLEGEDGVDEEEE